jgi:hypothetical protein
VGSLASPPHAGESPACVLNLLALLRPIRLAGVGAALAATAACGSDTGVTTVDPPIELGVNPEFATISVGDSVKLTVILPETLAAAGATYVSARPTIAITRTNGWVIGVARGNTTVVVTSIGDSRLSKTVSVSVGP